MFGKWIILLVLIQVAPLFSCQPPPETELNANLDPAQVIIDSPRHERWLKKVDGKNQYQRNHWKKCPRVHYDHDRTDSKPKDSLQLIAEQIAEIKAQQTTTSQQ